jgi:ElaB/YqjD/DUF883 family membrane-anchored ribosome-binding protein
MLEENFKAITRDVNMLMKDAQALFQAAAALTGEKADDMRKRGMLLIDTAMARAQELQTVAITNGKEAALSANVYVRENPWRAVATAGGLGLLLGLILGKK